jgi:transposase
MNLQHIIGADLSKRTIDFACNPGNAYIKIENSAVGFKKLMKWIKEQNIDLSQTMIVMEHTGLYSYQFEIFLHKHHICFCKINALLIKRSIGIVRGKTDKLDAKRIAAYGFEKKEKLAADVPVSNALKRLQMLYATRERLVRHRAALSCAMKEYKHIGLPGKDLIMQSQQQLVKNFDRQIKRLMTEMEAIIEGQKELEQNYNLLLTIKGVGKIVALITIIKTHNFTRFSNARKFACFCGTAPFEHSSGTSIKRKSRVSPLADRKMKTLLDLAAKSAIQNDKELRTYFLKRTEAGKPKMSTINIVRNKILYRMFAVVKRQTPFLDNYLQAA